MLFYIYIPSSKAYIMYCRTHNVRVCLYIVYIACGSASLCCTFFLLYWRCQWWLTVANIKICYDAKTPQFAIFGTCVICVFYSMHFVFPSIFLFIFYIFIFIYYSFLLFYSNFILLCFYSFIIIYLFLFIIYLFIFIFIYLFIFYLFIFIFLYEGGLYNWDNH